jgi:hypothetical protein
MGSQNHIIGGEVVLVDCKARRQAGLVCGSVVTVRWQGVVAGRGGRVWTCACRAVPCLPALSAGRADARALEG